MAISFAEKAPKPPPPKRKRKPGGGRKKSDDPMVLVTLRVRQSVLARFQAYPDWRARMNDWLGKWGG